MPAELAPALTPALDPWQPLCMDPDDLARWHYLNRLQAQLRGGRNHVPKAEATVRPCVDCLAWFADEMERRGLCNAAPGERPAHSGGAIRTNRARKVTFSESRS